MELEEIRNKYQCDEGRTFAQWKEWVRKNKPSQAETHIVTAVAPNGSKYERLIGGYTDAQNTAFDLVAHGYKNVKMFKSVNAGPMKLLRNFSAPLHGAKFKDSDVSTDAQDDKKFFFQVFTRNGKLISKIKAPDTISTSIATRLAEQESKKFKKNWYKCQIVDQNGRSYETYYNKVPSYNGTRELAQKNMDSVDEIRQKYANDVYSPILGKEFSGKGKDFDKALKDKRYEGLYKQIDFYLKHYSKQKKLSDVQMNDLKRLVNEIRSYGKNGERWVTEVKKTVKEFKDSDDFAQDKLLITSNGFANGSGVLKKDTRKGLKPFEVAFFVKGKDGKPFKTVRSKMAASLEEAKRWANQESRKYNGVTKVEVKEFKDSADSVDSIRDKYAKDAAFGVKGRRSYNDSADGVEQIRAKYQSDAYNLGMETKEFDPKAPLKVISVTTKKEPDGISGRVTFTKGKKKTSERFMVYKSGNWDVTPGGGFGITGLPAGDKQTLMNAVRNKLSTMGIKAK